MTNKQDSTFLQFNFSTEDGAKQAPLLFSNPLKVITTRDFEAIPNCLAQIEQAVEQGFYVAGYFSYEMTYAFLEDIDLKDSTNQMPLLWFGVFKDTTQSESISCGQGDFQLGDWKMQINAQTYQDDFDKIMKAIQNKQTKQINYTVPFEAPFMGSSYHYYQQLKEAQQSNFCAYLHMDQYDVLSASPELFFHLKDDYITVRPMKGTARRGLTAEEDIIQKNFLQQSEKNRLENNLITKLMKKELEKVTAPQSVQTIDEYRIEKYPTVYQMTTGVQGIVKADLTLTDIIKSLFPCGSISGVPKTSSLQLIKDIENKPREVYCGAIGYITPNKDAIFNVPIRTVWIDKQKQKAFYGAGGAITSKSNMQEEYEEVLAKTDVLTWKRPEFDLLETMAMNDGHVFLLDEHLHRLQSSATYFDIPIDVAEIKKEITDISTKHSDNKWRLRLTVDKNGKNDVTVHPLTKTIKQKVILANKPINRDHLYLYHKTTHRTCYDEHMVNDDDILDVLLWNDNQEITEFTIGNIVIELDEELVTPPVSSGLLAGTFRNRLLENGEITEKVISKEDLKHCNKIWLINSVRQWIEVELV